MASILGTKRRARVGRRDHATLTRCFDLRVVARRWAQKVATEMGADEFHDTGKAEKTSLACSITRDRNEPEKAEANRL